MHGVPAWPDGDLGEREHFGTHVWRGPRGQRLLCGMLESGAQASQGTGEPGRLPNREEMGPASLC